MSEIHTKIIANTGNHKVVIADFFKCILQKNNTNC